MENIFDIEDQDLDLEIYSVSDATVDEMMIAARESIKSVPTGDDSFTTVESSVLFDLLMEVKNHRSLEQTRQMHFDHCNAWPYENACKYGDLDCPSLLIRLDIEQLAQALFSVQGGINIVDGTWNSDIVQRVYIKQAQQLLKILVKSND